MLKQFKSLRQGAILSILLLLLSSIGYAQETLIELIRSGQRNAALSLLNSSDLNIDAQEPDGSTALHWASYSVEHELAQALLDAGATVNTTNHYGSTPLTEAVKLGDDKLVRMLLDAGADPDSPSQDNQTVLMLASHIGSLEIAEMLIEKGADVNAIENFRRQTALMWAAAENHPRLVELLVVNGADVTIHAVHDDWPRQMTSEPRAQYRPSGGLTALLYAARSGCYQCAVSIVEAGADVNQPNPDGITPLLNALDNKSFDIAMYLIDQGAKVGVWDMYGRTPVYLAFDMNSFTPVSFGSFGDEFNPIAENEQKVTAMDVARRLIAMGVDINHQLTRMRPNGPGRGRFVDYDMRGGTGPLMVAALSRDHEAMELLLQNGAEVSLYSVFKITPLMAATGMSGNGRGPGGVLPDDFQERTIKSIDMLLEAGADINAQVTGSHTKTAQLDTYIQGRDNEGRTPLHSAAELAWEKVVVHLLELGADPNIKDYEGQTPLDEALAPILRGPAGSLRADTGDREATIALLSGLLEE